MPVRLGATTLGIRKAYGERVANCTKSWDQVFRLGATELRGFPNPEQLIAGERGFVNHDHGTRHGGRQLGYRPGNETSRHGVP